MCRIDKWRLPVASRSPPCDSPSPCQSTHTSLQLWSIHRLTACLFSWLPSVPCQSLTGVSSVDTGVAVAWRTVLIVVVRPALFGKSLLVEFPCPITVSFGTPYVAFRYDTTGVAYLRHFAIWFEIHIFPRWLGDVIQWEVYNCKLFGEYDVEIETQLAYTACRPII